MRRAWLFTLSALAGGVAHAAPLTYPQALQIAEDTAPSLEAKGIDVSAARASAIAAGRRPDPKVQVGVEGFPVTGPFAWRPGQNDFSDVRVGVMQDLPNGAKRQAARERAGADIGAAEANRQLERRTVRLNTALAWVDLYYAERKLAALDDIDRALAPIRQTAVSQVASGASRPAQSLVGEQLTAALDDRRADLVGAIGKARAELVRWTGDAQAEVTGDPPAYDIDIDALRADVARHASLAAYDAMGRQADAEVAAAKAEKRPDWSWQLAYQHRDPRWGDMVSVVATVSLPLFARNRQDPIIAARTQTANRVRIERQGVLRTLTASLDADLADHFMHHDRLTRAQVTLVPLAERKADLERASYAAGTASLGDVLGAFRELAEARVDLLDREAEVARDGVRINLTYRSDAQ